jgi:pimeloyl-ACP methyl ester carboxylesterase
MQQQACSRFVGLHVLAGAGHWVQQEQPQATTRVLLDFLAGTGV